MARKDYNKDLYKNAGKTPVSEMIADRRRRWLGRVVMFENILISTMPRCL